MLKIMKYNEFNVLILANKKNNNKSNNTSSEFHFQELIYLKNNVLQIQKHV